MQMVLGWHTVYAMLGLLELPGSFFYKPARARRSTTDVLHILAACAALFPLVVCSASMIVFGPIDAVNVAARDASVQTSLVYIGSWLLGDVARRVFASVSPADARR